MNYTEKKQLLEEFTEGLEILFLKRGRGSKIYSSDLDRTLKFFTQSINRVEKAERERMRGRLSEMRKEVVVTKRVTRNLGQGNYSTLEDGGDIFIRNPKMTENEQEQGIGYNQALDDLISSLQDNK